MPKTCEDLAWSHNSSMTGYEATKRLIQREGEVGFTHRGGLNMRGGLILTKGRPYNLHS